MPDRRTLLQGAVGGLIAVSGLGGTRWLTPAAAAAEAAPLAHFSAEQAALLAGFAGTLVLGAAQQGVVHYIDHQVGLPPADCLLTLRYLEVAPPYADFYRRGLAALSALLRQSGADDWNSLGEGERQDIVAALQRGEPQIWSGPPPPLFYFAVRSDSVDLVYGSEAGFARLGIPYLPHIPPDRPW
jgi:hypothetical protein